MIQSITAPPRVRAGDTVAVVAPSGPVNRDRLVASLPLLEARYKVRIDEAVFARSGYLAGSDERRADELNAALADPDVRAVFVARGGFGATRILPLLDPSALISDPKPLIGFSDATALLGWAWASASVASIHGPVAAQLAELPAADVAWLFELLENPRPEPATLEELPGSLSATGVMWGGNLSLVAHCDGTATWPAAPQDAIAFFEDVGERPYAIDRYLTRLIATGALEPVTAALVGDLSRCVETTADDHPSAEAVVRERLESAGVTPVFVGGFGHGDSNRALPFGSRVTIESGRLHIAGAVT